MNRLGMLVDLSHVSPDDDATGVAREPGAGDLLALVGARALADHPRNVPDDVLKLVQAERRRRDGQLLPGLRRAGRRKRCDEIVRPKSREIKTTSATRKPDRGG